MRALPALLRFRLAAYILGATACVELVQTAAALFNGSDTIRTGASAWGVAAAVASIAAGVGAYRAQRWAPVAFAIAAFGYLGRAASVSVQVWVRVPQARQWAAAPLAAGIIFTAVALWLAWGAARAGERES